MNPLRNFTLVWVLMVLMVGCQSMGAPAPETNKERLAFLELSFGTMLDKALLYKKEGRFTAAQKEDVSEALHDIDLSIEAAHIAVTALDDGAFDTSAQAINTGMVLLRKLLTEAESQ